ncbi:hypothetical protein [uncultured Senegalimassilia sp.]|uniref:hypothetical protein n=1 Tax=uncultured Senegalimassilia sp. TaxID=1714350 RepID=UPI0026E02B7D|nr:hypothetical protein [uncultured Senegalimassilia sp.]
MNPEELFADDRSPVSEQERVHEDELRSLMRSILDWAISFLSEPSHGTVRAIYFEGKTVKQHSEEEHVAVYAIYKRHQVLELGQWIQLVFYACTPRACAVDP